MIRSASALLFLFVCVTLLLAIPTTAQRDRIGYSLAGAVYAQGASLGLSHVTVELCDENGHIFEQTATNDAGTFMFNELRTAQYLLRLHADGFANAELRVDLNLGSQRGLVITLKPVDPPASGLPNHPAISVHELTMPEAARELMNSGVRKLYKDKEAQAALSDFQSAVAKAPNYYEAYYELGITYLTLLNEPEAEKQFRKSVDLSDKKYGNADIALATMLLGKNQAVEGETLLRAGLALNPRSWQGQIELSKLELSRGHVDLALMAAEQAKSLAPLQPVVYRLLSLIHLKQKNYAALRSDLDAYIRLDPDSPIGLHAKQLRAQIDNELAR